MGVWWLIERKTRFWSHAIRLRNNVISRLIHPKLSFHNQSCYKGWHFSFELQEIRNKPLLLYKLVQVIPFQFHQLNKSCYFMSGISNLYPCFLVLFFFTQNPVSVSDWSDLVSGRFFSQIRHPRFIDFLT